MTLSDFLTAIDAIERTNPVYKLGGDGSDGECDCVGLIIGAMRWCGLSYKGIHGSNWFARNCTDSLMRISDADDLSVGDIVYKAKAPGESGYDLPARYSADPDQRDYYHIGVVTDVEPLRITHCTSGGGVNGIMVDGKLGKWTYKGQLKELADTGDLDDNTKGVETMTYATVTADSGSTVNLRKHADVHADLVERVPVGSTVQVVGVGAQWCEATWRGRRGYMMRSFLTMDEAAQDGASDAQNGALAVWQQDVMDRLAAAEETIKLLAECVSGLEGGVG